VKDTQRNDAESPAPWNQGKLIGHKPLLKRTQGVGAPPGWRWRATRENSPFSIGRSVAKS
jgi:hypothetical protein